MAKDTLVMISGTCCLPWLSTYESELERDINSILQAHEPPIAFVKIPVTQALHAGLTREVYKELMALHQSKGILPLPALVFNQRLVGHSKIDLHTLEKMIAKSKGDSHEN